MHRRRTMKNEVVFNNSKALFVSDQQIESACDLYNKLQLSLLVT